MFEFKVGMKVRVRPDLNEKRYENFSGKKAMDAVDVMLDFAGEIVTLSHIDSDEGIRHTIQELSDYVWSDTMFIPPDEEAIFDMLVCDSITEKQYKEYITCLNSK